MFEIVSERVMKKLLAACVCMATVRTLAIFVLLTSFAAAQPPVAGTGQDAALRSATPVPRVLIVVAHPDDESCFAATVYEITHNLGGVVDQLVITNGEGGYRYSLLAESFYGVALTDEAIGRGALPEIRKRELLEAGHILGIANHFFLDQLDRRYTQDIEEVLGEHWSKGVVLPEVERRIAGGNYDFVFTLFPSPDTHGGHKAATITALNAVQKIGMRKPVVLGCQDSRSGESKQPSWQGFQSAQHPFSVLPQVYVTDRTVRFGFNNALDYQIIVNWVIAAHKSQGAFQMGMNGADREEFVILESGVGNKAADEAARTDALFHALGEQAAHPKGVGKP
jgi:LmbE family N-acetylglucosaminyl deacetylase